MGRIKTAIAGFGFMGHTHGETVKSFPEMELTAVCDTDTAQLKDTPAGVSAFTTLDEMLKKADFNVVIISTPNPNHEEAVIKCAKAGKHIICEKPAALTVEQFDRMVNVCKENNVIFTVHQQRRFDKDFCIMKEVYSQRLLGAPYIIKSQLYGVNGNMHDWHVFPEMGGGMLYDWGVHLIDQILYMVDSKIVSLYADVRNIINEKVDDYFKILLKFTNGVLAEIELGTYYLTPKRAWFIGGDKGSAYIDGFAGEGKIVRTAHLLENVPGKITMSAAGPTRSFGPPEPGLLQYEDLPQVKVNHRNYFENFIKVLNGSGELLVKAEQVRRVLLLMDAVRKSGKTGEAVRFE
ncbi:MAG: Gfo/Idh/MocA family oxidoreductase [Treponema sp.]|jgi:predicted dehydrogenase|nr:Gfo/Idh/MocA family oxidoreductase [Treponema sp.]